MNKEPNGELVITERHHSLTNSGQDIEHTLAREVNPQSLQEVRDRYTSLDLPFPRLEYGLSDTKVQSCLMCGRSRYNTSGSPSAESTYVLCSTSDVSSDGVLSTPNRQTDCLSARNLIRILKMLPSRQRDASGLHCIRFRPCSLASFLKQI